MTETYEITCYEGAIARLEVMLEDMRGDYPGVGDADIIHSAVEVLLDDTTIDPKVRVQVAQRELGWDPESDSDLLRRHGLAQ